MRYVLGPIVERPPFCSTEGCIDLAPAIDTQTSKPVCLTCLIKTIPNGEQIRSIIADTIRDVSGSDLPCGFCKTTGGTQFKAAFQYFDLYACSPHVIELYMHILQMPRSPTLQTALDLLKHLEGGK